MSATCQIKWIDCKGKVTPDDNPAVGVACCTTSDANHGGLFLICAEHAETLRRETSHHGDCSHKAREFPWRLALFEDPAKSMR